MLVEDLQVLGGNLHSLLTTQFRQTTQLQPTTTWDVS